MYKRQDFIPILLIGMMPWLPFIALRLRDGWRRNSEPGTVSYTHLDVYKRQVINEAVELAKVFGAEQGHRFINGVLDQLARVARPLEFAARS